MGQEATDFAVQGKTPLDGELVVAAVRGDREAYDLLINALISGRRVAVSYRLLGECPGCLGCDARRFFERIYEPYHALQKPEAFAGVADADCIESVAQLSAEPANDRLAKLPLEELRWRRRNRWGLRRSRIRTAAG